MVGALVWLGGDRAEPRSHQCLQYTAEYSYARGRIREFESTGRIGLDWILGDQFVVSKIHLRSRGLSQGTEAGKHPSKGTHTQEFPSGLSGNESD